MRGLWSSLQVIMSDFTYETKNTESKLETYEWDNVWWEQTGNKSSKRVLYIGDSISCGTRRAATAASSGKLLFDGFGTSKALDNPYFEPALKLFSDQQRKREAVIFNNGLHGWHLSDEEYKSLYEKKIDFLISQFEGTPVFVVLTTAVLGDSDRYDRVIARNRIAEDIAAKKGCPIIDLFKVSEENAALHTNDGVHFNEAGYEGLAKEVVKRILEEIPD